MTEQILDLVPLTKELPSLPRENTLYNLIQAYLETKRGLQPTTIFDLRDSLVKLELFLENQTPTPQLWIEFQKHLCDKFAPSTIRYTITRVRSFFQWCEDVGFIERTPCRGKFNLPPIIQGKKLTFSHDEYEALKVACVGANREMKYQLIVCCYAIGCNPKDICLMRWPQVDFENQVIRYVRFKMKSRNGIEIEVPFDTDSDIHKLFVSAKNVPEADRPEWPKGDWIFPDLAGYWLQNPKYHDGSPFIYSLMKSVFRKAGITDKTLKNFRNTFCSELMNSGVNPIVACQMTGHTNPKTLTIYCKPEVETLREAIATRNQYSRKKKIVTPKIAEKSSEINAPS